MLDFGKLYLLLSVQIRVPEDLRSVIYRVLIIHLVLFLQFDTNDFHVNYQRSL